MNRNRKFVFYGVLVFAAVFTFLISACDDDSALKTQTIDAECNCTDCSCVTCECDCENCDGNVCEDPNDHEFTLWQITRIATCTVKAEETEKCSRCSQLGTITREVGEFAPHTWTKTASTEADCTNNATETWTCSVCITPDPDRNPLVLENTAECNCTICVCNDCDCDCPSCVVVEFWAITWHFNGGTAGEGAIHQTQIPKGGTITFPNPLPMKNNANFMGWFTDLALTQMYTFVGVSNDLNLYAKWQQVEIMLYWGTYIPTDPNGGYTWNIQPFDINELVDNKENARSQSYPLFPENIITQEYKSWQSFTNQTTVTTTGVGYHYIVTPNKLSDITMLGVTSFNNFIETLVVIDGVNYFVYYDITLASATFNMVLVYQ